MSSTKLLVCDPTDFFFHGARMRRGTCNEASKLVCFPHSPCSPSCHPWSLVTITSVSCDLPVASSARSSLPTSQSVCVTAA
eukprot:6176817-Pleurochrysis_carterae.AAC.1